MWVGGALEIPKFVGVKYFLQTYSGNADEKDGERERKENWVFGLFVFEGVKIGAKCELVWSGWLGGYNSDSWLAQSKRGPLSISQHSSWSAATSFFHCLTPFHISFLSQHHHTL